MNGRLEAALKCARRGWPVLLVRAGQKAPATSSGLKDATTDEAVIRSWFDALPEANFGIRTGVESGLVAVDVDVKNGQPGRRSFAALNLPKTLTSLTPSGGWHSLYKHPGGTVKNRAGLRPGIDIRGDGGYIVAPSSCVDGKPYQWVDSDAKLADLPESFLELLKGSSRPISLVAGNVAEGGRNDYLTRAGGALRNQGLSREAIEAQLLFVNQAKCNPPLSEDEVKQVAASISQYPGPQEATIDWPDPMPLPDRLPPVAPFDLTFMPHALAPWIEDVAERMHCPPDFPAMTMLVAASALIGRKVVIRPKQHDDWTVVPNLWGALIGRPSTFKSPAMLLGLKPVHALEASAREDHENAMADYQHALAEYKNRKRVAEKAHRKALESDAGARMNAPEVPEKPTRPRLIIHDTTVEKLGVLMNENPNGLLYVRDELVGWLRNLDKPGREGDRAFFLEAWNGDGSFSYDRIGRGTIDIPSVVLSVIGGMQPDVFMRFLRRAYADDGMVQRFQLLVWPDPLPDYQYVDRKPNEKAKLAAYQTMKRLHSGIGSVPTEGTEGTTVSFVGDAVGAFQDFSEALARRTRGGDLHPMLESHLGKYASLVPSLALINHLLDGGEGDVSLESLTKALGLAKYLETHAFRAYATCARGDMDAAYLLAQRIEKGDVPREFSGRDIYRKQWSGLGDKDTVHAATAILEEYDWLVCRQITTPGRTKTVYEINPKIPLGTDRTEPSNADMTVTSGPGVSVSDQKPELPAAMSGVTSDVSEENISAPTVMSVPESNRERVLV